MFMPLWDRATPPAFDELHPLKRLVALATVALIVAAAVGTFAGILVFVTGLAGLATYAAAHATQPQRPSVRDAWAERARAAGPRGTRR
jgi:hypothetical protein